MVAIFQYYMEYLTYTLIPPLVAIRCAVFIARAPKSRYKAFLISALSFMSLMHAHVSLFEFGKFLFILAKK